MAPFRILLVDDIESNRVLLRTILRREGHEVIEATSGAQALEIFAAGGVDLALLDVMMPDIDGLEVCRKMRSVRSANVFPILFITAKFEDIDLVAGLEAGANDYITKPINKQILLARLNAQLRLLGNKRTIEATYEHLARKKRMETVGLFAAGVAHNFNNILGTILGSAELLKHWRANEEQFNKAIDLILRASRRGADLTDSLLTFTQATSKERCESPADAAKAAITMLPLVSRSDVTFILEIDEQLPAVRIPSTDLSQVFVELVRNSVEAIGESGTVYIRAKACLDSVVFEVEDTGRGMAPETADHLFEPFYSTKNLDTVMGIALDGSGLGLTSVYNLVSGAGGEIAVGKSSPTGTMISFSLPIAKNTMEHSSA